MYNRDDLPKKQKKQNRGCEFCLALNTFTYVSSTRRDSVLGGKERSQCVVKWMAGEPAEALGSRGQVGGVWHARLTFPTLLSP